MPAGRPPKDLTPLEIPDDMPEEHQEVVERLYKIDVAELYEQDQRYQEVVNEMQHRTRGPAKYTVQEKLKAAMAMLVTANARESSDLTGIPAHTIKTWAREATWWNIAIGYAKESRKDELHARFGKIIHQGLDQVERGLREGDYKVVKVTNRDEMGRAESDELKMVAVPIKAKDAMAIVASAREKQSLLDGEPTSISAGKSSSEEEMLQKIADKIAGAVKDSGKVIEGMVIKSTHED